MWHSPPHNVSFCGFLTDGFLAERGIVNEESFHFKKSILIFWQKLLKSHGFNLNWILDFLHIFTQFLLPFGKKLFKT